MNSYFTKWKIETFSGLQDIVVPRVKNYNKKQRSESIHEVEIFLRPKKGIIKFQISLFLIILEIVSIIRFFSRIHKLTEKNGIILLNSFCNSPIPIMRKGFWGISTLAKLSVYALDYVQKDLGYEQPSIELMKKTRNKI